MPGLSLSPDFLVALIVLPFGLIVGSFANVVIHRLPLDQSVVFPASRCPKCLASIKPWQNVPVLSWLFLLGRCASCKEPISARYPLVEALHGVGFALIVWKFGLRPFTLMLLVFFSAMVVLALIDWDHQILPDVITLPGILAGIFGTFLPGALIDWREAGLSVTFGYVAFFLVAEGYLRLRGIEGLGQGDWKLAAMMGAFLGWQRLLLTVFLGSVSGMTYGLIQAFKQRAEVDLHAPSPSPSPPLDSAAPQPSAPLEEIADAQPAPIGKYKLPFGTFLAASAIVVLFAGDPVLIWYGSLFRP